LATWSNKYQILVKNVNGGICSLYYNVFAGFAADLGPTPRLLGSNPRLGQDCKTPGPNELRNEMDLRKNLGLEMRAAPGRTPFATDCAAVPGAMARCRD
jgi:hypothetical protein